MLVPRSASSLLAPRWTVFRELEPLSVVMDARRYAKRQIGMCHLTASHGREVDHNCVLSARPIEPNEISLRAVVLLRERSHSGSRGSIANR